MYNNDMKRAAAYTRFSSEKQTESSTAAQMAQIIEYAKKNGYVIVKTYSDEALSGFLDANKREGLNEMIQDAKRLDFAYVLVWNFDRLARKRKIMLELREFLEENGITLISITQEVPKGPEGIIIESVYDAMAEIYSWNLARNVMRGMIHSAKNGGLCGRNAPFGYINVYNEGRRQIAIDPDRSQAVRKIFEMYANGATMLSLAKWLNENKYRTKRGNVFTVDSVRTILTNEIYKGVLTFNKKRVRGKMNPYTDVVCVNVPQFAIVSVDLWERAQRTRATRAISSGPAPMLQGLFVCTACGRRVVYSKRGQNKFNKEHDSDAGGYYYCSHCKKSKGTYKAIGSKKLEDIVLKEIRKEFDKAMEDIETFTAEMNSILAQESNYLGIRTLEEELEDIDNRIKHLTTVVEQGNTSQSIVNRLVELEDVRGSKMKKLKQLTVQADVTPFTTQEMAEQLTNYATGLRENRVLRNLISEGTIDFARKKVVFVFLKRARTLAV